MATDARLMTTEELLAIPDDGVERWLIRGELREGDGILTTRGNDHTFVSTNFAGLLWTWLQGQPQPRGVVLTGEVRVRLRSDPDSTVGIDLVYVSPEGASRASRKGRFVDGPPTLAIEILSPSDKSEDVAEKIQDYLDAGVPRVWLADPNFDTVTIYRPDALPEMVNVEDFLTAEPQMPGLRIAVSQVFRQ